MSSNMKTTIVAGIFSIIGVILGITLDKYLPPISTTTTKPKIEITNDGTAEEIILHSSVSPDFSDSPSSYQLTNLKLIVTSDDLVHVTGSVLTSDLLINEKLSGDLEGNGIYLDGMVYIHYLTKFTDKKITSGGVATIQIPRAGNIKGYWIAEESLSKGQFSFGSVSIKRTK